MKWLTCTPVRFCGDESFFLRDSGLLCKSFQANGMDSKAVMPGPPMDIDLEDLIRMDFKNLEDPSWWKGQNADGVVLYAWGMPKFIKVIKAINGSGTKTFANLDNNGIISPVPEPCDLYGLILRKSMHMHGVAAGLVIGALKCLKSSIPFTIDLPRFGHLEYADIIGAVSPIHESYL